MAKLPVARIKVTLSFYTRHTSMSAATSVVAKMVNSVQKEEVEEFYCEYSTPHPPMGKSPFAYVADEENEDGGRVERGGSRDTEDRNEDEGTEGRARSGSRARADDADGDGSDGKPKRGRGRPKGSGKAEEGRSGNDRDEDGAEGNQRNVAGRTDKGSDKADGNREEGRGRSGRNRDDQRGNRQSAEITENPEDRREDRDDDGWGDDEKDAPSDDKDGWDDNAEDDELIAARSKGEWPDHLLPCKPKDIDKTVIQTLLGDHHKATGGKDRTLTFDLMEETTGERSIKDVAEKDYPALARALMKDAAKYEYGLKK